MVRRMRTCRLTVAIIPKEKAALLPCWMPIEDVAKFKAKMKGGK